MSAGTVEIGAGERTQGTPARRQAAQGALKLGEGPIDEVDEGIGVGEGAAGTVGAQDRLPALPDLGTAVVKGGDQIDLHPPTLPRPAGRCSAPLASRCAPVGAGRPEPHHVMEALSAARSAAEVISFHSLTRNGLPLEKFTRDSS